MTTKTKAKTKPTPAPTTTSPQPAKTLTSEDLATQCDRCGALIDSLELQMTELESQHTQHEQALEKALASQEARHERFDALRAAITEKADRVTGLKMSIAVTAGTPSEPTTQAMLSEATAALEADRRALSELEQFDIKQGTSDAKANAAHSLAIEQLETQYQALESQVAELHTQHEQLFESLGQQIYREFQARDTRLQEQIEQADAERRGTIQTYQLAQSTLRQEALQDLADWPHINWRLEAEQNRRNADAKDERHERQPLVALLRAHQAFLKSLQQHGWACAQRRYGQYDLTQVLSLSPQVVADALLKPIDFKPRIEEDDRIIEQHT